MARSGDCPGCRRNLPGEKEQEKVTGENVNNFPNIKTTIMAETVVKTPSTKNVVGWVVGVLMLGAVAFAIGYGLKKGQKVAA